jgi:23S rRNA (guanosine2251-2'-O)-methyltransferase
VPVLEVSLEEINRLAPGQNTQGVAAQVAPPRALDLEWALRLAESRKDAAFLLVLDQIQDPHNLGALMRTADATGVQAVVVPERRNASITGTVVKASAGAASHLPYVEVTNLARALDTIRGSGLWTVGLDGAAEQTVFELDLRMPLALVVGSEGSGLRRLTRERCDFVARLPMLGRVESLNAAVAGSVAMYEILRQRSSGGP